MPTNLWIAMEQQLPRRLFWLPHMRQDRRHQPRLRQQHQPLQQHQLRQQHQHLQQHQLRQQQAELQWRLQCQERFSLLRPL